MDMLLVNLVLMGYLERDLSRARRVLRGRVGGDRRADPGELSGRRPRRVPHRHRRPRRGGHQGVPEEAIATWWTRSIRACPASMVGREQEIEVGPMSGQVERRVLARAARPRGRPTSVVERIFAKAKASDCVLTEDEIRHELATRGSGLGVRGWGTELRLRTVTAALILLLGARVRRRRRRHLPPRRRSMALGRSSI